MLARARRIVYAGLGLVFVGLAVLGMFLPVLPTTPFLLVALWAFSASSKRLETWLLHHPRFGPRLVAWRKNRVVPLPVKLTAWGSMIASLSLMIATGVSPYALIGAGSVMAFGAIYIARCPSRPPAEKAATAAATEEATEEAATATAADEPSAPAGERSA